MDTMFEILMSLPLFNGVSRTRLNEIVGSTKFHFLKYLPGETIITPGEQCTHIKFVISGSVRSSIANSNDRFTVAQTLEAPAVISPEFLFGRSTFYPCHVEAITTTGILQIAKNDYVKLLKLDSVFMYNFMNIISMKAQQAEEGIMALTTGSLEERIAFWITSLTQSGGKDITLAAKKRDLYSVFGVQRSSFMATLDSLKERGIIDYDNDEIKILSRRELLRILHTDGD